MEKIPEPQLTKKCRPGAQEQTCRYLTYGSENCQRAAQDLDVEDYKVG